MQGISYAKKGSLSKAGGDIEWNPMSADKTRSGHYISPSTVLEHESAHTLNKLSDYSSYSERIRTYSRDYDNQEEEFVIRGAEARTAIANGEIPRGTDRGTHSDLGAIMVPDPRLNSNPSHLQDLNKFKSWRNYYQHLNHTQPFVYKYRFLP